MLSKGNRAKGIKHLPILAAVSLGAILSGCRAETQGQTADKTTDLPAADPWKIVWRKPVEKGGAYLTNGLLGLRIGADGKTLVKDGGLTYTTSAGSEEMLSSASPLPLAGTVPSSDRYAQTLDLQTGTLTTRVGNSEIRLRLSPTSPSFHLVTSVDGKTTAETGNAKVESDADAYWKQFWKTDIEVDGPVADQQAIRSFLFYLRSSIRPEGQGGISPYGLSNALYKGHVFWDADTWIFPALAFLDPERAATVPRYRLRQQAQYEANAKGTGLKVPWESARSGKEVAPPNTSEEIQVTGSVCFGLDLAATLGLADARTVDAFCAKADRYYQSRAVLDLDGQLELKHVGSVDESHTVDNDLYTNLLAQWLANGRSWRLRSVRYLAPHNRHTLATYTDDSDLSHKQAAAVLSIFPLQFPEAQAQALSLLARYAPITIKEGPAMTDSIEATILARYAQADAAYDQWEHSWQDFVKPPHLLFSEHRATQETYFLTGAAGCLQTVLYGFVGFRIDSQKDAHAAWSTPLKQGKWLNVTPHLPKAWKTVRLRGLRVLGNSYTMTVTQQGVSVIRGD